MSMGAISQTSNFPYVLVLARLDFESPSGKWGLAAQDVCAGREAVPLAGREAVGPGSRSSLAGREAELRRPIFGRPRGRDGRGCAGGARYSREHGSLRGGGELREGSVSSAPVEFPPPRARFWKGRTSDVWLKYSREEKK